MGWLLLFCVCVHFVAAQTDTTALSRMLTETTILSNWAQTSTPITVTTLNKKQIAALNTAQDIPFVLRLVPGVVETSDAGTGIGYTNLRLRGIDQTRINVTINGVPINDAESHQVYWVNMPDIVSSASSIQVQRGVGSSTHGGGAFGGSIHINTNSSYKSFIDTEHWLGTYGTRRHTLRMGIGKPEQGLQIDGRVSVIRSEGYIDRATARLNSWYGSAQKVHNRHTWRITAFGGNERTYQAWYGLPHQYLQIDTLRTYNPAGTERFESPYPDQVDNYTQRYTQAFWTYFWRNPAWYQTVTAFYTRGFGYYEEYKANQYLQDYNLPTGHLADVVRQRWLDNHNTGGIYSLNYRKKLHHITFASATSYYKGQHFGQVLQVDTIVLNTPHRYYNNFSYKWDATAYIKGEHTRRRWLAYWDLQYRHVNYSFEGPDASGQLTQQTVVFPFFNPKAGLVWQRGSWRHQLSAAVAHREPNRADFVDSSPNSRPRAEQLIDLEWGSHWQTRRHQVELTAYYMHYNNQLVPTGRINDVGSATRINVPRSLRRGIEGVWHSQWHRSWQTTTTIAFNDSRIRSFDEYIDNWETGTQSVVSHNNTPIAYSPRWVTSSQLQWLSPVMDKKRQVGAGLVGRYISGQYLDNTANDIARIPGYGLADLRLSYNMVRKTNEGYFPWMTFTVQVLNLTSFKFVNNGWVYRFDSPGYNPLPDDPYAVADRTTDRYQQIGWFPQAGRQILAGVKLSF
jgi:iron complex outermembrane receptor protein